VARATRESREIKQKINTREINMSVFSEYKKEIMDAATTDHIRLALSRAIKSYYVRTSRAMKAIPHTVEISRGSPRRIKKQGVDNLEKLAPESLRGLSSTTKRKGII